MRPLWQKPRTNDEKNSTIPKSPRLIDALRAEKIRFTIVGMSAALLQWVPGSMVETYVNHTGRWPMGDRMFCETGLGLRLKMGADAGGTELSWGAIKQREELGHMISMDFFLGGVVRN